MNYLQRICEFKLLESQLADLPEKPAENVDLENILPSVHNCVRNCSFT